MQLSLLFLFKARVKHLHSGQSVVFGSGDSDQLSLGKSALVSSAKLEVRAYYLHVHPVELQLPGSLTLQ